MGTRGGVYDSLNSVDPIEFLFITDEPDRSPANYRPVNPRWWEYVLFFHTGPILGTLFLGTVIN